MAKTLNVEYTDPVTGTQKTIQVSVEIERYRRDTELGAVENFFLKVTGSGADPAYENVDDLVVDLIDGRPSKGKRGVVQSLIDTEFTSGGVTLSVLPAADTAGFVANVPCVVLNKYGDEVGWFMPTVVGADFTIPAANEGALDHDCEIGWIVQQPGSFPSSLAENSQLGIKAQMEQPTKPTAVTGTDAGSQVIHAGWTKPADVVITHYDIYCIKSATVPTAIEPNDLPSVADRAASSGSADVDVAEYFDETTMALLAIDAGTYFIGVVAKDGAGHVDVNESEIGWSAAITVA